MTRIRHLDGTSKMKPKSTEADRQTLFARLEELGIASVTVEHEPVFTVEESQSLRERLPGAHTKNLFLVDKDGRAALVVAKDDTRVDLKSVAKRLGIGRPSFGKPERLLELLGVTPGSVTPFALINDKGCRVTVILDADMMRHERLNFHPLENTATTNIAREDLTRFIQSCGHQPSVLAVAQSD